MAANTFFRGRMLANPVIVYGPIVLYDVKPNNGERFAGTESVSHRSAFCVVVCLVRAA